MATFLPKWFLISPCLIASGACSWMIEASSEDVSMNLHVYTTLQRLILTFDTHVGGRIADLLKENTEDDSESGSGTRLRVRK